MFEDVPAWVWFMFLMQAIVIEQVFRIKKATFLYHTLVLEPIINDI